MEMPLVQRVLFLTFFGALMAFCGGFALARLGAPEWAFYLLVTLLVPVLVYRCFVPSVETRRPLGPGDGAGRPSAS